MKITIELEDECQSEVTISAEFALNGRAIAYAIQEFDECMRQASKGGGTLTADDVRKELRDCFHDKIHGIVFAC